MVYNFLFVFGISVFALVALLIHEVAMLYC